MTEESKNEIPENAIAVIGLSGRFPDAQSIDDFWQNLLDSREAIHSLTPQEMENAGIPASVYSSPGFVAKAASLKDYDKFDAAYFDIPPGEAEVKDPQHKALLECTESALQNAAYVPEQFDGLIGIYAGIGTSGYLLQNLAPNADVVQRIGLHALYLHNEKDFAATFVAYKLGLKGPALNINTGCSTSLVAIHTACKALQCFECDIAVAGAASISAHQKTGYQYQEGYVMSQNGQCRPFDADASGTLPGHGAAIVVLKRYDEALEDGDHIHGVILGSAVNNDGNDKIGFTAPSVQGQSDVIQQAIYMADVDPDSIQYIECHGTGTKLGDPIEFSGIQSQYQGASDCFLGAVKANIGHLNAASGVAGLIKTIKVLETGVVPAAIHYEGCNPDIPLATSRFIINKKTANLTGRQRRGAVSSFGIGGTNAHLVMQCAGRQNYDSDTLPFHILLVSGKCRASLNANIENLANWLTADAGDTPLADIAYTLQLGRRHYDYRVSVVASDWRHAVEKLNAHALDCTELGAIKSAPEVVFCFPGQGAQHINMAYALFDTEGVFRETLQNCHAMFYDRHELDILGEIFTAEQKQINETHVTQPVLFSISYALAQQYLALGIRPNYMIGHSLGEIIAACIAEVFSLPDAIDMIAARGKYMAEAPRGAMVSVQMPSTALQEYLGETLFITGINGLDNFVVGGDIDAIASFEAALPEGVLRSKIATSHAFHSPMMKTASEAFRPVLEHITFAAPNLPFISNVTGQLIREDQAMSVDYWVEHLLAPVNIGKGIETLMSQHRIFLEVGPGRSIISLAGRLALPARQKIASLPHVSENKNEFQAFSEALAQLWCAQIGLDWRAMHGAHSRKRVPLPGYAFQRKRLWIDAPFETPQTSHEDNTQPDTPPALANEVFGQSQDMADFVLSAVEERLGVSRISSLQNYFELGGDSLMATQIVSRLRQASGADLTLAEFLAAKTLQEVISRLKDQGSSNREREYGEI